MEKSSIYEVFGIPRNIVDFIDRLSREGVRDVEVEFSQLQPSFNGQLDCVGLYRGKTKTGREIKLRDDIFRYFGPHADSLYNPGEHAKRLAKGRLVRFFSGFNVTLPNGEQAQALSSVSNEDAIFADRVVELYIWSPDKALEK